MDHYTTLGISKSASTAAIKKAYRALAKKYHPDRNPDDAQAEANFKKVSEAYGILSDPEKKKLYDNPPQQSFNNFEDLFRGFERNPFEDFINPTAKRKPDQPKKKYILEIDPQDVLKEKQFSKTVMLRVNYHCSDCDGKGGDHTQECVQCRGSGKIKEGVNHGAININVTRACNLCHGRGHLISGICYNCQGQGKVKKLEEYKIDININKIP